MKRMNDRVEEINALKSTIEQSHIETTSNLQQLFESTKTFADETKANIEAGASANTVSETKANFVHNQVNDLHEKTRVFTDETTGKLTELKITFTSEVSSFRDGVQV